ncbi:hypothetical protein L486_02459 [Kwoniella mangroviensis CBS 10435]|uniref:Ubiquitin-like protease family profile domain-containing protein n=1 Tax=Kwoniella mangroviensis CBS 10435 TaxID=1331196 RepID=A0A1B9IW92_9TREE|nr:hypothetical protein L486_02459 [Kwoniella mangroviensis CBS 10435]
MSRPAQKRRSSSVSYTDQPKKRRKSSPSPQKGVSHMSQSQPSSRSAPQKSHGFLGSLYNTVASFFPSNASQSAQEILKPDPNGSLAMLMSHNKPSSSQSSSSSINQIPIEDGDGEEAGSSAHPIDFSQLDDDEEIPSPSKGKRRSVSPKKNDAYEIAGPSRQKQNKNQLLPMKYNSSPNLFMDNFGSCPQKDPAQPQSIGGYLPTPPDSQQQQQQQQKPEHDRTQSQSKQISSLTQDQLDRHVPTPPDSQVIDTNSQTIPTSFSLSSGKRPESSSALRKKPTRPDVTLDDTIHPRKGWEIRVPSPSSSSSGSTSSRSTTARKTRHKKKYKSNLRNENDIAVQRSMLKRLFAEIAWMSEKNGDKRSGAATRRVAKMLTGDLDRIGKASEYATKVLSSRGMTEKQAFQTMMMLAPRQVTLEDKTTPQISSFSPLSQSKIAQKAKAEALGLKEVVSFERALKELKKITEEEEAKEREIKEKLKKPKVPPKLKPEQEAKVSEHLNNPAFKARVSTAECESKSIRRLKNGTWLDDEIMNFYGALMVERANQIGTLKVHAFNSFFYQRISETGYSAVKRWTKRVDIFSKDLVVFPVNIGNMHWTACAINLAKKRIEYFDSMGDYGNHRAGIFKRIRGYLNDEHQDKKKKPFDFSGWTNEFNENTPQQDNGSDCGVFSCQTLEMITRGRDLKEQPFEFASENMPFFRRLMVWEIGNGKLEKREWGNPKL